MVEERVKGRRGPRLETGRGVRLNKAERGESGFLRKPDGKAGPRELGGVGSRSGESGKPGKEGKACNHHCPQQCQCFCGGGLETQSVVWDLGACLLPEGLLGTQHLRPIPTLLNPNIHFNQIRRTFLCTLMCEKYCHLG